MSNWIADAADELVELSSYAPDCDSDRFMAVIMKHLPFKQDIAYMPVPRCDGCKHWQPHGNRETGDCSFFDYPPKAERKARVFADDAAALETDADFGCVQWEAK